MISRGMSRMKTEKINNFLYILQSFTAILCIDALIIVSETPEEDNGAYDLSSKYRVFQVCVLWYVKWFLKFFLNLRKIWTILT